MIKVEVYGYCGDYEEGLRSCTTVEEAGTMYRSGGLGRHGTSLAAEIAAAAAEVAALAPALVPVHF